MGFNEFDWGDNGFEDITSFEETNDSFKIYEFLDNNDYEWINSDEFEKYIDQILNEKIQIINLKMLKLIYSKLKNSQNNFIIDNIFRNNINNQMRLQLINEDNIEFSFIETILNNSDKNFVDYFLNNDERAVKYVESKGIMHFLNNKIPSEILNNNIFFEQLKNNNLAESRILLNRLGINNDISDLEKKFDEYYKNIINCIEKENFEAIDQILKQYDNNLEKLATDIFYNYVFKDTMQNVLINVNEMIRYQSISGKWVMNDESLRLYRDLLKFEHLNYRDIITKIEEFNKLDIVGKFYDDMRQLKDLSYKGMINGLYTCKGNSINDNLSKQYNIDIYVLDGEKFNMMIRATDGINNTTSHQFDCYSLIGDTNLNHFHYSSFDNDIIFGYNNIDYRYISGVLEKDSMTDQIEGRNSNYVNRIMTSSEIIESDREYSEINIQNEMIDGSSEFRPIKPDFIVMFDNINEERLKMAKQLNLPVVLINSKSYSDKQVNTTSDNIYSYNNNAQNQIPKLYDEIQTNFKKR